MNKPNMNDIGKAMLEDKELLASKYQVYGKLTTENIESDDIEAINQALNGILYNG